MTEEPDDVMRTKMQAACLSVSKILGENVEGDADMPGFVLIVTHPQSPQTYAVAGNVCTSENITAVLSMALMTMPEGEPHERISPP